MKILATYNIKGGVGKTSTAVNISHLAARDGLRVLLWDLDAQKELWERLRVATEAGGAAAYAGLKKYRPETNEKVGVLICGGNTTAVKF